MCCTAMLELLLRLKLLCLHLEGKMHIQPATMCLAALQENSQLDVASGQC